MLPSIYCKKKRQPVVDSAKVFSRQIKPIWATGSRGKNDGVVFGKQATKRDIFANSGVTTKLNSLKTNLLNFLVDHGARQAKFRDALIEHSTGR
jgi:hypothetical protein